MLFNKRFWLRHNKFVAREFAWLDASREGLFSPTSNYIFYKLLPTIFFKNQYRDWILGFIDIKDIFLTMKQKDPTLVYAIDALGTRIAYSLGRMLPGQRTGS